MTLIHESVSIVNPDRHKLRIGNKIALTLIALGMLVIVIALAGFRFTSGYAIAFSLSAILAGAVIYARTTYLSQPAGIKNKGIWISSLTARGGWSWMLGIFLTGFYVALYWFPNLLGLDEEGNQNKGLVALFDPLSNLLNGKSASQWFVYGTLYTVAILAMGYKFILKYRHSRYHLVRTISIMIAQLFFAYLIPEILEALNSDKAYFAKDLKNMWPLNYYFFDDWHIDNMQNGGTLGMFYLVWGIALFVIAAPVVTYFVGKRWYCSWICGCGGLAETAGDPFRHLSSKKISAWKLERWMIYSGLVLVTVMTSIVLYGYFKGTDNFFGLSIYKTLRQPYGFLIGAVFSGVIGVGFYPLLGSRVWCRFGCPLAAYIGIVQRFKSRFRITTNGGQCISCGNCSTYCEMGIDVRAYSQKGQNIVRAGCVGCGICATVCPRGVLKLENGDEEGRIKNEPFLIGRSEIKNNE